MDTDHWTPQACGHAHTPDMCVVHTYKHEHMHIQHTEGRKKKERKKERKEGKEGRKKEIQRRRRKDKRESGKKERGSRKERKIRILSFLMLVHGLFLELEKEPCFCCCSKGLPSL